MADSVLVAYMDGFLTRVKPLIRDGEGLTLTPNEVIFLADCIAFRRCFEFTSAENSKMIEEVMLTAAKEMEKWRKYMEAKSK